MEKSSWDVLNHDILHGPVWLFRIHTFYYSIIIVVVLIVIIINRGRCKNYGDILWYGTNILNCLIKYPFCICVWQSVFPFIFEQWKFNRALHCDWKVKSEFSWEVCWTWKWGGESDGSLKRQKKWWNRRVMFFNNSIQGVTTTQRTSLQKQEIFKNSRKAQEKWHYIVSLSL